MALLSPIFNETHFKSDGTLASGYKIYTYIGDSDIAATTYTTEDGDVAQANPIILNARGELDNPIWLSDGTKYKFIFTTSTDVVIKTIDNIIGVSTPDAVQDQWIEFIGTATYISSTSFSVVGDQTSIFDKGRALKLLTSGGTVYANVSTSAYTTLTTITVGQATGLLDTGLTGTKPSYGVLSGTNPAIPAIVEQKIQNQTGSSGTTTGTSSALVFTPSLAYAAPNVAKQAASVTLHVALTGGAVTLQFAGQSALPLVNQDGTNPVTPINYIARVESNGTQWVITNSRLIPTDEIRSFTAVANTPANGVTITIPAGTIQFRSTTLATGAPITRTIASPIALVISNGSTLGAVSGVASRIAVLAIDNAGTVEVAAVNMASGLNLDESGLISTTAEGGAGAADSAGTIYSTTSRTNVAYRVVGYYDETQATAGTHSSALTLVQGMGGEAKTKRIFRSQGNSFAFSTTYSVGHNFGITPDIWKIVLRCTATDAGYAVGDVINVPHHFDGGGGYGNAWANATQMGIGFVTSITVKNKTTTAFVAITASSWVIDYYAEVN